MGRIRTKWDKVNDDCSNTFAPTKLFCMKFSHSITQNLFFIFFSSLFIWACEKENKTYPYVLEYEGLSFSPSSWYVLTDNAQTQIGEPALATAFEAELKTILEEGPLDAPISRMEFLSGDSVKVTFSLGLQTFDTTLLYTTAQNETKILWGGTLQDGISFYSGSEPNSLRLGIASTVYFYRLPNGEMEFSPIISSYSNESNAINILQALRSAENLKPTDTVGVNIAAYLFE